MSSATSDAARAPRLDAGESVLLRALRVLADPHESHLEEGTRIPEIEVEWLLGQGLGPLLYALRPPGGLDVGDRAADRLRGADLTSRALTHQLLGAVEPLIGRLQAAGVTTTVLKGVSFATRYYPEPHLRVMSDIDLLVDPEELDVAAEVLRAAGFEQPDTEWRPGHHAPPLRHPQSGLWVELHHALRPPRSPEAAEAPFAAGAWGAERQLGRIGRSETGFLGPECELALITTGWCYDLKTRFGLPGSARALVDVVHLLAATADDGFDWDRVMGWSHGSYTGACIGLTLEYLRKHDACPAPADVTERILRSQVFVRGRTLRAVHALLDRYVVAPGTGRLATPNNIASTFDALIAPRSAWRNLLAVPLSIAFPGRHPERFKPGFMLGRLRSTLGRGPRG
jgi:hypothetical protein